MNRSRTDLILLFVVGFLLLLVGVGLLPLGVNLGTFTGLAEVELGSGPLAELLLVLVQGHDLGLVRFGLGFLFSWRGVSGFTGRGGFSSDLIGRSVDL